MNGINCNTLHSHELAYRSVETIVRRLQTDDIDRLVDEDFDLKMIDNLKKHSQNLADNRVSMIWGILGDLSVSEKPLLSVAFFSIRSGKTQGSLKLLSRT